MSRTVVTGGVLYVDGQPIRIVDLNRVGPEVEWVNASVPDTNWSYTDGNGHVHRWWLPTEKVNGGQESKAQTPTLVESLRHIDCDGSCPNWDCEGYDVRVWHCFACGEEVEAGFTAGSVPITKRGPHWRLISASPISPDLNADLLRNVPAHLEWPSGAGQITTASGRVWETAERVMTYSSDGESSVRREFELVEATRA